MVLQIVGILVAAVAYIWWPRRIILIRVVDGDSIEATWRRRPVRIRISGYDAPEYRQPGGRAARTALEALSSGKTLRLVAPSIDRYGRLLGPVIADGRPIAWDMVSAGHGWPEGRIGWLLSLPARIAGRGLWSDPRPVHPSLWRAQKNSSRSRDF